MSLIVLRSVFQKLIIKNKYQLNLSIIKSNAHFCTMEIDTQIKIPASESQEIIEGKATIKTGGKVFYNIVQEFNRDLSISVITAFAKKIQQEKKVKEEKQTGEVIKDNDEDNIEIITDNFTGVRDPNGITILEALSATGLRSIRYAKEIPGVKEIIANDISARAAADITQNVASNNVQDIVVPSQSDALMLMYQHRLRENQFDVIDLDPYGCPSIFLESAVQAVKDGGLLLVTATDMAVLAGNTPETCYVKYGAVSLKIKSCHEMAIRILLQTIESHANRYGRCIEPLLSISADFYIRVFVRVFNGQYKCKFTTSKLSYVYHCTGCDSFTLQPLGILKANEKNEKLTKFCLPTVPPVSMRCEHCNQSHHMGGPIWSAPIHSANFVREVLDSAPRHLRTYKRIHGVLTMVMEELPDVPLYYGLDKLTGTLHSDTPPILTIRSAILNAGYRVSYSHMYKSSIKTDAPNKVIWDIMRCMVKQNPLTKRQQIPGTPANFILSKDPEKEYSFAKHPGANPESRRAGYLRFQENPIPYWGPGNRATAMLGDNKAPDKQKRNQNKRKREVSQESGE